MEEEQYEPLPLVEVAEFEVSNAAEIAAAVGPLEALLDNADVAAMFTPRPAVVHIRSVPSLLEARGILQRLQSARVRFGWQIPQIHQLQRVVRFARLLQFIQNEAIPPLRRRPHCAKRLAPLREASTRLLLLGVWINGAAGSPHFPGILSVAEQVFGWVRYLSDGLGLGVVRLDNHGHRHLRVLNVAEARQRLDFISLRIMFFMGGGPVPFA